MKRRLTLALLALAVAACDRAPNAPPPEVSVPKPAPPAVEPAPPTPAPIVDDRLTQAQALKRDGKLAEARSLYQELAATNAPEPVVSALSELNTHILFSPAPAPEKADYTVQ